MFQRAPNSVSGSANGLTIKKENEQDAIGRHLFVLFFSPGDGTFKNERCLSSFYDSSRSPDPGFVFLLDKYGPQVTSVLEEDHEEGENIKDQCEKTS